MGVCVCVCVCVRACVHTQWGRGCFKKKKVSVTKYQIPILRTFVKMDKLLALKKSQTKTQTGK